MSRATWDQLPAQVRAAIEERIGSPVIAADSKSGGYSPGLASVLTAADGRRIFVKACGPEINPDTPGFHRAEARIAALLPAGAPVPHFLWSLDEGADGWISLAFEALNGRNPHTPWVAHELDLVIEALTALSASLTPSPVSPAVVARAGDVALFSRSWWGQVQASSPEGLDDWSRHHLSVLVECSAAAREAVAGDTLIHCDLRADNMLLTERGVVIVDWPHARVGAAWVDMLGMAPSVELQNGPRAEDFVLRHPAARAADPAAVTAALAQIAGYFTYQSLQPPPPSIPTVRAFQAAQGEIARRWLADRTAWR